MTPTPCKPGNLSTYKFDNPDCPQCRGIKNIVESNDNLSITIYYTDGTSQIFTLPKGDKGDTGASGITLLKSDVIDHVTTTNGSFETLSSFSTDHTDPAKNLVNVGDTINLYSSFKLIDSPAPIGVFVKFNLNGVGISNLPINLAASNFSSDSVIELFTQVILVNNTSGAMFIRYSSTAKVWKISGEIARELNVGINNAGGATVDFAVNNYTFSAVASSVTTGDTELQIYQAEKLSAI